MFSPYASSSESLLPPAEEVFGAADTAIDSGELFHEIASELAFSDVQDELMIAISKSGGQLSGVEDPRVNNELLGREKAFFTKAFGSALSMAEAQPGTVTLLFDLDQTLIHGGAVRPAFPLLLRELDDMLGERLEIGILSSRRPGLEGREEIKDELIKPISATAGVDSKLNRDFVISSGHIERASEPLRRLVYGNDTESQIKAVKDVICPEVIADIRAGRANMADFYDTKLVVLQSLVSEHPERGFVIVDDFPHAGVIDPDSLQARGVWVKEEILENSWQPYAAPVSV